MKDEKTTVPSSRLRPIPYEQVDYVQLSDSKKPNIANSFGNFLQQRKTIDNQPSVESKEDFRDDMDDDEMGDTNEFNIKSDTFSPK